MPIKLHQAINKSILKAIPNPTKEAYEIKIKIPEFTFLGVQEQPDFANVYLTFYPKGKVIELKSLKQYAFHLRDIVVSYERLINVFYDHLMGRLVEVKKSLTIGCMVDLTIHGKL